MQATMYDAHLQSFFSSIRTEVRPPRLCTRGARKLPFELLHRKCKGGFPVGSEGSLRDGAEEPFRILMHATLLPREPRS